MTSALTALDKWPEVLKTDPIRQDHCYVLLIGQHGVFRGLADAYTITKQFNAAQAKTFPSSSVYLEPQSVTLITQPSNYYGYMIMTTARCGTAGCQPGMGYGPANIGEYVDALLHVWSNEIPGWVSLNGIRSCDQTHTAPSPTLLPRPPESPVVAAIKWAGIGAATLGVVYVVWRFFPRRG